MLYPHTLTGMRKRNADHEESYLKVTSQITYTEGLNSACISLEVLTLNHRL